MLCSMEFVNRYMSYTRDTALAHFSINIFFKKKISFLRNMCSQAYILWNLVTYKILFSNVLPFFHPNLKFHSSNLCYSLAERVVFSSPQPKAPGGAYSIGRLRRPSVRPSTISNDFSFETTGPIATKFHIQPPGTLGKKKFSNGLSHMTNMAAMPMYGKNLKKSSSPEPIDQ